MIEGVQVQHTMVRSSARRGAPRGRGTAPEAAGAFGTLLENRQYPSIAFGGSATLICCPVLNQAEEQKGAKKEQKHSHAGKGFGRRSEKDFAGPENIWACPGGDSPVFGGF